MRSARVQNMKDKVVIVTGGSSGIGRSASLAFAREGCQVIVASRDLSAGHETVDCIKHDGGEAFFIKTDVQNSNEVQKLVNETVRIYGQLDYALNNAGIEGEGVPLVETTEEQWDSLINTNLKGVWLCLKYQIQQMIKQNNGGSIVNTSSVLGLVANRSSIYTASKHGVNGLTKSAALTYADKGIRVNAVCPGYIDTAMVIRAYAENQKARLNAISRHPIGRLGTPEEVAEAIIWLCSDAASFVTGSTMSVDGGYSVQ
jgi:NAD(P)-dependent dehydrogenase (short-subunit alcohol dehydrogenase family)